MVSHLNTFAGTYLELPLRRHYFRIDTTDIDTSVETSPIMRFDEITSENLSGAYRGVEVTEIRYTLDNIPTPQ